MPGLLWVVVLLLCEGCLGREAGEEDDPLVEEDMGRHADFQKQQIGLETGDDMNSEWALGKALQGKEARGSGEQKWKNSGFLRGGGGCGKMFSVSSNTSQYF